MTRADCQDWLAGHGWTKVPRSACIGCPFRSNQRWRELRDHAPSEWADAVAFDRAIRSGHAGRGRPTLHGRAYLHHSLVPLDQANLAPKPAREPTSALDGFGNECEGICAT